MARKLAKSTVEKFSRKLDDEEARLMDLIEQLDQAPLGGLLLRQWNLPESIWRAVHYQDYPYFAPASAVPALCRREVAALFLARLCYYHLSSVQGEVFRGPFFDDYQRWSGIEFDSLRELAEDKLLASLKGAGHDLPGSARQFLQEAVERLRKRYHGPPVS